MISITWDLKPAKKKTYKFILVNLFLLGFEYHLRGIPVEDSTSTGFFQGWNHRGIGYGATLDDPWPPEKGSPSDGGRLVNILEGTLRNDPKTLYRSCLGVYIYRDYD